MGPDVLAQIAAKQKALNTEPTRPGFTSLLDPKTGLVQSKYQTTPWQNVTPNSDGIDAYRKMALGTGPSDLAKAQLDKQALDEQGLKNATEQQADSAAAGARSALASKYGLSPAASERLAVQNMRAKMGNLQNVGFQGAQARATIGSNDAAMRAGFLQSLPGQENNLAQIGMENEKNNLANQQYNIGNAINQTTLKNAADLQAYHEQMQSFAANKQADAMRNSGGGGKK